VSQALGEYIRQIRRAVQHHNTLPTCDTLSYLTRNVRSGDASAAAYLDNNRHG